MGAEGTAQGAHVLVFPCPAQGHINPMLQFAKRLLHKGLKVSLVATTVLTKSIVAETGPISLELISDGSEDGQEKAVSTEALERFKRIGSQSLNDLILKLGNSDRPVDCLVYDSFLPWALDVAKQVGIPGAAFFTQTCAVEAIYYNAYHRKVSVAVPCEAVSLPGLLSSRHQRVEEDQDYGVSLWKKDSATCKEWLDSKDDGSVVYVSFGSIANLGSLKMEEIACALKDSDYDFLWVVRESEESNLPEKFAEESKEKGIVVRWCPQLEVLSHRAVGCFVTHCGWNSTLEALTLGVPMVAYPQWSDQPTNAKYIEDVWRVGVRAKIDDEGIVRREELKNCLKEIMEGERGVEIKRNAFNWRKRVKEALEEGGSSDKNIEEFVTVISG
ncbi:mogroside IE synthase-like [Aristolochia californica]|uniref:mogroside IE synthase-like n=1 Tax=Aristolochia californica TaxID=171875 RepID=UPI0035E135C4